VPFIQTKQADAKAAEVGWLVALQWHTSGGLQALGWEFFAGLNIGVGRMAYHHAWRLAPGSLRQPR
jgi:hypothetical protein